MTRLTELLEASLQRAASTTLQRRLYRSGLALDTPHGILLKKGNVKRPMVLYLSSKTGAKPSLGVLTTRSRVRGLPPEKCLVVYEVDDNQIQEHHTDYESRRLKDYERLCLLATLVVDA